MLDQLGGSAVIGGLISLSQVLNGAMQRAENRKLIEARRQDAVVERQHTLDLDRTRADQALKHREHEVQLAARVLTKTPEAFAAAVQKTSTFGGRWHPPLLIAPFEGDTNFQFARTAREKVQELWLPEYANVQYGYFARPLQRFDADLLEVHEALTDSPSVVLFGRIFGYGLKVEPRVAILGVPHQIRPVTYGFPPLRLQPEGDDSAAVQDYADYAARIGILTAAAIGWAWSTNPRYLVTDQPAPVRGELLKAVATLASKARPAEAARISRELGQLLDDVDGSEHASDPDPKPIPRPRPRPPRARW